MSAATLPHAALDFCRKRRAYLDGHSGECEEATPSDWDTGDPGVSVCRSRGNLDTPRAIKDYVRGYEEEGCHELVMLPTVPDIEQLDRLADALA